VLDVWYRPRKESFGCARNPPIKSINAEGFGSGSADFKAAMGMARTILYELQNSSGSRVFALSKPQIFVNLHQSKSIASSCKSFKINRLGVFVGFGKLAWGARGRVFESLRPDQIIPTSKPDQK
jgi:hypothetical protein